MTELWYYKQYNNLIVKCQEMEKEGYPEDMYTEVHHILPKCQGGTNDKCNLVRMPVRYHIFAHIFLMKAFPNNPKLVFAAFQMTTIGKYTKERKENIDKLSVRLLSELRESNGIAAKLSNTGRKRSKETKRKLSEARKRRTISEESRVKISNSLKKYYSENKNKISKRVITEETRKKMSEAQKNKNYTIAEKTRKKMSESRKGIPKSEEHKRKISESNKGKHHTEESKKKMSDSRKGKPVSEEVRKNLLKWAGANKRKVIGPDGTVYDSITEASKKNNLSKSCIRKWINSRPEKGFRFYTEE